MYRNCSAIFVQKSFYRKYFFWIQLIWIKFQKCKILKKKKILFETFVFFSKQKMKKKNIKDFKLVMLGVSGVGKTSLIQRFTKNIFNGQTPATYGLSYLNHSIAVENTTIKLNSNCILKFSSQYFSSNPTKIFTPSVLFLFSFFAIKFGTRRVKRGESF